MKRTLITIFTLIIAASPLAAINAPAQTWYDLTLHNATFSGTNLISGDIHPPGIIPTMPEFRAAQDSISQAHNRSLSALDIALAASNRADSAWHDVADLTSNGVWEVAFTISALRGIGAGDDIASETVGFNVEVTPSNRLCHAVQWFSDVPPTMPDFTATHTTNLLQAGFEFIEVSNSYPATAGASEDYGKIGGACYRVTAAVPLEWGTCFFKITATGFVIRGNYLPVVGGVTGGASYDIQALDLVGGTNIILNVRGGFIVNTNNPLTMLMLELK